jgi:hypothetical protein
VAKRQERKIKTYDVLVLKPQVESVYFVVEGMRFNGISREKIGLDEVGHKHYFYEEHSCPTNWLKPTMVYVNGDADPHGLIEFVATIDASTLPPDQNCGPNNHDRALIELVEQHAVKAS